jgi:hypothetical protein
MLSNALNFHLESKHEPHKNNAASQSEQKSSMDETDIQLGKSLKKHWEAYHRKAVSEMSGNFTKFLNCAKIFRKISRNAINHPSCNNKVSANKD